MIKNKIIFIILMLNSWVIKGQQDTSFLHKANSVHLFNNKDLGIDFKFLDPAKGSFGIDYKINLERKLATLNPSADTLDFKNFNLNLDSKGFVTVVGEKNNNNSLISELKLELFPIFKCKSKQLTRPEENWLDHIDDPNLENDVSRLAAQVSSPLWLFCNIHAKHETTQDFRNYDFAFGGTVSLSSSILNAILDLPFGILRSENNNNPRQIDISLGYDYVVGVNNTEYANLNDSLDNLNRINLKAEWETGIFTQRDRIVFLFDSYYDLSATDEMKAANEDWKYFYMIKLEHALRFDSQTRTQTKVSIKYTEGELPPNFQKGYILGGGLSLEF